MDKEFRAARSGSDIILRLQASHGLPIEGVMSRVGGGGVVPEPRTDPTIVSFRLPLEDARYVVYGIVTPLSDVSRASYKRSVLQDERLVWTYEKNPERFKARKLSAGEWIGHPEVIRIKVR